ncbi:cytochrome c oxidase assembly protein [Streptomyces sp. CNZ748]|uniref:cytochrome c oxidase assembly protein n=1 Tax=Streptomyces sp. CNZ748 TaxID=2885160 RepID=UPI0027DFD804|nr:cytochrome c oxidase assembly protein [Streptomyces sp. CNZ748]
MTPAVSTAFGAPAVLGCVLAGAAYVSGAVRLRRRGDAWPWWRDCVFAGGCAAVVWGLAGPVPGGPFTAHTGRHLLVAMAGPALLAVARPLTLVLRLLSPGVLRRGLLRVAHSPVAGWLLCPPVAAVVDIGGLWALYRTDLWSAAHRHPVLGGLLELHMLLAGLLFAMAVCAVDPVRRRSGLPLRAVTLLAAGAAHAVLAKSLYAAGPPGTAFAPPDLRSGAQLMYYGGDAVEVLLALTLAVQWYVTTGRRRAREAVRSARVGSPSGTGAHAGPAARGRASARALRPTRSSR